MILTTILVVVGLFFGGVRADKCCEWPISAIGVNSLNVTLNDIECDEPIRIDCARAWPNDGAQKVGIAGFKDRSDTSKYTILAAMEFRVQKTVICSPSNNKWYPEGSPEDKFSGFTCAFLLNNGTWQYVFY
ncbi:hypothetical protein CRE_07716 [Caenorhabditis remanei]|uniref:Uncharacterized protein n=1 Tax=Caenorhabditis remanei TaxID=31234 RepID=E3MZT0_CAERE|nr:hypothetical protein CRE_07716 [Caenorhabditis remanei]